MIHALIDFMGILGIASLAVGLWMISPVWMFCVIGAMFICFALCAEAGSITVKNRYKKD